MDDNRSPTMPSLPGTLPGSLECVCLHALRSRHGAPSLGMVAVPARWAGSNRWRWRVRCEGGAPPFEVRPELVARAIGPVADTETRPSAPGAAWFALIRAVFRSVLKGTHRITARSLWRSAVSVLARSLARGRAGVGVPRGGVPSARSCTPIPRFAPRGVSWSRGPTGSLRRFVVSRAFATAELGERV